MHDETLRIAHHEAGHAVVYWTFGIPLRDVRIDGKEGITNTVMTEAEICAAHGAVEGRRIELVVKFSGACAQQRGQPGTGRKGDCDDHAKTLRLARELEAITGTHRDDWFELGRAEAEKAVADNWHRIEALAQALLNLNTIAGPDAEKIIDSA